LILNPDVPEETKDFARQLLKKVIQRVARRVAKGWGQVGTDLVEEAFSWVLEPARLAHFDPHRTAAEPSRAPPHQFETWCSRVLHNRLLDLGRRRRRQIDRPMDEALLSEDPRSAWPVLAIEAQIDLETSFCAADLEAIRSWKFTKQCLTLLCLTGLWRKVPESLWRELTVLAGIAEAFPPESFLHCQDAESRQESLADALDVDPKTLNQYRHRYLHLIHQLDFVRELGHGK